jgi:hypothetical protein
MGRSVALWPEPRSPVSPCHDIANFVPLRYAFVSQRTIRCASRDQGIWIWSALA